MVLSKVLEKAMHSRLSYHLHANNILVTERYGCRKVVSTEDAAFRLTDSVFKSVNKKCVLEEFFCDLAKAFVCVNHETLLAKLHFCGILGVSEVWFRSCSINERQKFEITLLNSSQNVFSDWGTLKHGVPQGSIPVPLLFVTV